MIIKRPSVPQDYYTLMGRLPPVSVKSVTWELDEQVVAIAGTSSSKMGVIAFSHIKEDVQVSKVRIWKEAKKWLREIPDSFCASSPESVLFLKRLGWTEIGGGFMRWQTR